MARCSLILSNMEKSLGSHECGPKGLSNFGCLPWKCSPLNYYSEFGSECPFDIPSEKWYYAYNNGWTSAEANEIKLDCLKGNFPKY